jgi:hypothetical protein
LVYTLEGWRALKLVGIHRSAGTSDPDDVDLELRNCSCGSTIAVPALCSRCEKPIRGKSRHTVRDGYMHPSCAAARRIELAGKERAFHELTGCSREDANRLPRDIAHCSHRSARST